MYFYKRFAYVGLGFIVAGIILGIVAFTMVGFNLTKLGAENSEIVNNNYQTEAYSNLEINISVGNLEIEAYEEDYIWIETYETESLYFESTYDPNEDTTYITQNGFERTISLDRFSFKNLFSTNYSEYKVIVHLPEKDYSSISITVLSGNVEISELDAAELNLSIDSGNITLDECDIDDSDILVKDGYGDFEDTNLNSAIIIFNEGDAYFDNTDIITGKVSITGSGDLYFDDLSSSELTLSITSGVLNATDIDISKKLDIKGTSLYVDLELNKASENYLITCVTRLGKCNVDNTTVGSTIVNITISTGDIAVSFKR